MTTRSAGLSNKACGPASLGALAWWKAVSQRVTLLNQPIVYRTGGLEPLAHWIENELSAKGGLVRPGPCSEIGFCRKHPSQTREGRTLRQTGRAMKARRIRAAARMAR